MSAFTIYWEPHTEVGRVALLKNLDAKLLGYQGKFPEITSGAGSVVEHIHNAYLMADWLVTGSSRADTAKMTLNSYKSHLFVGPASTSMNLVPAPAVYGAAPTVITADVMAYIRNLRGLLMKNTNWTEAIAKDLQFYGADGTFDPNTYVPDFSVNPFTGYIHIHVATKHVHNHHAYIRKAGTTVWEPFIQFNGSNFDNHRVGVTSPENLEILLRGVIDNGEIGLPSVIIPFLYKTAI